MTTGQMAPEGAGGDPGGAPRRRRRRLGPALRCLWLLCLLPVVFALVAALGLIGQEVRAPSWITRQIEAQAAEALAGGSLRFGAITVTIAPDLHPLVRLREVELLDAAGRALVRAPLIESTLSPRGLILRRAVLPQRVAVEGPQIRLERDAGGALALAFDGQGAGVLAPANPRALRDWLNAALDQPSLAALEEVAVSGLVLRYVDHRAGRAWTIDGAGADLRLDREEIRLSARLDLLSGRDYATGLTLDFTGPRGGRAASLDLALTRMAAEDVASQFAPLSWLGLLDAPISARLATGMDAAGALTALTAELDISAGALAPAEGATPVGFDGAAVRMLYDPATADLRFDEIALDSDWGAARLSGRAALSEFANGLPGALIGQFVLSGAAINPGGALPAPVNLPPTRLDLRLRLDPFLAEIGQIAVAAATDGSSGRVLGNARIGADATGWRIAVDAGLDRVTPARVLSLWPEGFHPPTRRWIVQNIFAGEITDLEFGLRMQPERPPELALSHAFSGAEFNAFGGLPHVTGAAGTASLGAGHYAVSLSAGVMQPPEGGPIDLTGLSYTIPDMLARPARAEVGLAGQGSITAFMSLIDQPPLGYATKANLPVDLAQGRAAVSGSLGFPLVAPIPPEDFLFDISARLTGVENATLIPGRRLTAAALDLHVAPGRLTVAGAAAVGQAPVSGTFSIGLGQGPGVAPGRVEGRAELSPRSLREFAIALPDDMVSGAGQADFTLDLPHGAAPRISLQSDLSGVGLAIPAIGWRKPASSAGDFTLTARLGARPEVEALQIDAAGLRASGSVTLADGGGLGVARFDRLRVGGWLDAPVTVTGRGGTRPPAIALNGGVLDLTAAPAGPGGSGGESSPVTLRLDRLQLADGVALTGFSGEFSGGISGSFVAAVNGLARVTGTVVPAAGGAAVRIRAEDAGAVIRALGLLTNGAGGALDLTLMPVAGGGYDGELAITGLRVHEAPALASILNAISVVGLIQQMAGQGLVFDDVQATFRLAADRITVSRASAVGPGLGISLDGVYTTADRRMDFQGVISPFYLVNGIGSIFTRPGEGLIGFNFNLSGPVSAMQVMVNPLSALTPGMFREIFRRPAPVLGQ